MPLQEGTVSNVRLVVDQFATHWAEIDTFLPQPMVLGNGITRQGLLNLRAEMQQRQLALQALRQDVVIARSVIVQSSNRLRLRFVQFKQQVLARLPGSRYAQALPLVYVAGAAEGPTLQPLRVCAVLWAEIELSGGVFVLSDGYTRAKWNADLTLLQQAYASYAQAKVEVRLSLALRNDVLQKIRATLLLYRLAVISRFAKGSAYAQSLPRYSPKREK